MNAAKHRRRLVPVRRDSPRDPNPILSASRTAGALSRHADRRTADSVQGDPDEVPDLAQLEFVIQEARKAADGQWDAWKQADARIQFLLGLVVSMVTLSLALGIGRGIASSAAWPILAFAVTNLFGAVISLALVAGVPGRSIRSGPRNCPACPRLGRRLANGDQRTRSASTRASV